MRTQISAICVVFTLAAAMVVAQSSQRDTPSTTSTTTATTPTTTATTPTTTGTTPTTSTGSTAIPGPATTTTTRLPTEPAPLQLPPIGRSDPEAASVPTQRNGQSPCPGNPASPAGSSSSQFPGVSASQLPRAGVSADAFVRPGVSAAQLAALQPGARSAPCAPPRDVILYPDVGRPSRRVPPPGENEP